MPWIGSDPVLATYALAFDTPGVACVDLFLRQLCMLLCLLSERISQSTDSSPSHCPCLGRSVGGVCIFVLHSYSIHSMLCCRPSQLRFNWYVERDTMARCSPSPPIQSAFVSHGSSFFVTNLGTTFGVNVTRLGTQSRSSPSTLGQLIFLVLEMFALCIEWEHVV